MQRTCYYQGSNERNGVERFMLEFASFEKHTVRDLEKNEYTVELWYDEQDETEVLIMLLSFGPVIEILGPDNLRLQAKERPERQYKLLYGNNEQYRGDSMNDRLFTVVAGVNGVGKSTYIAKQCENNNNLGHIVDPDKLAIKYGSIIAGGRAA